MDDAKTRAPQLSAQNLSPVTSFVCFPVHIVHRKCFLDRHSCSNARNLSASDMSSRVPRRENPLSSSSGLSGVVLMARSACCGWASS